MDQKKIIILGSTGSVGVNALRVIRHLGPNVQIIGLAAHSNITLLEEQAREFNPEVLAIYDEKKAIELKKKLPHVKILGGMEGLQEIAAWKDATFVLSAMSGAAGILPTLAAIQEKKTIGLANKEVLVSGGDLLIGFARERGSLILPVDSEHSAIFQCLKSGKKEEVHRLILTASGGPFLKFSLEDMESLSIEQALAHPIWKMGPKISIDSSTLMNKGLEVIEAHFLFGIPIEKIEVIIHPQHKVHSFVEFIDGSLLAQAANPDMALPIQYAITYPERWPGLLPPFDFTHSGRWDFSQPDFNKFPCLRLAYEALKKKKSYPCYLNAANEVLVRRFLRKEFKWIEIGRKLEKLLEKHNSQKIETVEDILAVDRQARQEAENF